LLIAQSPPGTYDNILSDAEFVQQLNEAGYLEELNAADYVALVFAFIFLPIAASFVFSFNSERFPTIPLGHFTAHWYATALSHPDVWEAARASLIVSFTTAIIATGLGFSAAYTDYRYRFFGKTAFLALVLLRPTFPLVIMALAMLGWFSRFQASVPVWSIVLAHSVLTTPFAMAIIRLRLNQMDESLEAAAWNLGASQWRAMREVIIPFTQPAIVSALCLTAACVVRRVRGRLVRLRPQQDHSGDHPRNLYRQC